MRSKIQLFGILSLTTLLLAMTPFPSFAQSDHTDNTLVAENSINECPAIANGDREAFIDCIRQNQSSLREEYGLSTDRVEAFVATVENLPDWVSFVQGVIDRIEDRIDSYEDRWDRRENRWDRRENHYDRWEDRWDQWEDAHDDQVDREDIYDRREDWRDRREDHRDRLENRWDRAENRWDRREDRRDR